MNKKSTKKSPGSSKAATSLPETARDLRALWEQTRNNASPLEQAQEIMYDAWEANSPQAAIALAEKALSLSKDCADAYNLLAATSKSPEVAVVLYRRAIEAGKRTLGKRAFKEDVGYFWGILETRPYMRALAGLAENLWLTGEREEALVVYAEGLTLNPGDNQGLRYILMPHLLELGKDDEAEKLFKKFPVFAGDTRLSQNQRFDGITTLTEGCTQSQSARARLSAGHQENPQKDCRVIWNRRR
jgi:tetratricopeptide (TPR) repeat protein